MNSKTLLTLIFLFSIVSLNAQLEKTIHQTFEVEGLDALSVDLISDTTLLVPWAGNTILTETKVKLYDASPSIMAHFMEKEKRYEIEADTIESKLRLYSVVTERKPIRTRSGECPEYVNIRVFIPEEFKLDGDNTLKRTKD